MALEKVHVVVNKNSYFNTSDVHSAYTSKKSAEEFVTSYNKVVKKLNKLNENSIEDDLVVREMKLNIKRRLSRV